jgi:nucleoside 2-deoxyribosyltransferase
MSGDKPLLLRGWKWGGEKRISILAIQERRSVIDEVIEKLEQSGARVLSKDLRFSFEDLAQSDALVVRRDQRTPEIYVGIGYALATQLPIIAYWNLREEPPTYGFYGILPITATEPEQVVSALEKIGTTEREFGTFSKFSSPPRYYIAGDVRFADKMGYFFEMERILARSGRHSLNPMVLIDNYWPYKNYCKNLSSLPQQSYQVIKPGKGGAKACFELIELADGIITRVDDPTNTGPWLETGYAIGRGKPVVGIHKYPWPKRGKYRLTQEHGVNWQVIPEIAKHNKERFGLERWVADTQKSLVEILDELEGKDELGKES